MWYPKGFDITLADVIAELELSDDELKELGRLTATRGGIAHATIGHQVYYRKATVARVFNKEIGDGK